MLRKWHKVIPPKAIKDIVGYVGVWMPQMDRCWESEDGYVVMSRQIKTEWGTVEHITISTFGSSGDIPWAAKQEIKNELFGDRRIAIEVFPSEKNLVDVMDIYHLWLLPKDFTMPFGIHPTRDVQCKPVERGYDYDLEECHKWMSSPEREAAMGRNNGR